MKKKEVLCENDGNLIQGARVPNDALEIMRIVTGLKKDAKEIYTNLYLSNSRISELIGKGTVCYLTDAQNIFLFHKREQYFQVYFFSNGINALETFIKEKLSKMKECFVFNLVGSEVEHKNQRIKEIFKRQGISFHVRLKRMMRVNQMGDIPKALKSDFANIEDAKEVWDILHNFDQIEAQIPDLDEIETAASNKDIIVSRADGKIAAFFWTEHQGKTAFFRYWITRPEYRDAGTHGYFVYNQTLKREAAARRMILWVREDNANVIKIHQLNGFRFDGLVDDVFFKKGRGADD